MKLLADRLLADRLLAMPPTRDPWIERARDALKLPDRNHAPVDGDIHRPAVERFVFDRASWTALRDLIGDDPQSKSAALDSAKLPAPEFWLECEVFGWHFTADDAGAAIGVCFLFDERGNSLPLAAFRPVQWRTDDLSVRCLAFGEHLLRTEHPDAWRWLRFTHCAAYLLAAITSPRVTSVRRVLRSPASSSVADRAFARRRAQRGRPVFSYNQVDLVLPKTALHRGVLKPVESFAGMRGHMVIGHWRLIDGVLDPFWVWVDGHARGDFALGAITKERHVRLDAEAARRGFRLPADAGRPGERRPAERVAS